MDTTSEQCTPIRDYGISRGITPDDIDNVEDHRHQAVYIGLRLPSRPHRPHRSKSRRQTHQQDQRATTTLPPNLYVQNLICNDDNPEHETPGVFCQLDVLHKNGQETEWKETARWVKYEEDVEEEGERWSKPHVASLSLHSCLELRSCLTQCCMMLDVDAHNVGQVADLLLDNLINSNLLEPSCRDAIRSAIISNHIHQHSKRRRGSVLPDDGRKSGVLRSFADIGRQFSGIFDTKHKDGVGLKRNPNSSPDMINGDLPENNSALKLDQKFLKKIPDGAEVANILIGEVESLKYQVVAFIRLSEARNFGDLTEVALPTRFIFLVLGPPGALPKMYEIGRSMATIMVDEIFREVAFKASSRKDILAGIDEFLDQVTVLPPGEWDPTIRIEPPQTVPSQEPRKKPPASQASDDDEPESHSDPTLVRTGRLFGGLIADIKRKLPWYGSDFKDCLHIQCVASVIFLYLATLTPNVTFGGLLGQATDQYMGTMECILAAAITGVLFALFGGQPLNILGSTGPMLVLEMILYHFCHENDLDFLPFRFWIGMWTALILLIIVAFDLSALVRHITRFTEESFACLIALIFIFEAFKKLIGILDYAPVNPNPYLPLSYECECYPPNTTLNDTLLSFVHNTSTTLYNQTTEAVTYFSENGTNFNETNMTMYDMFVNWTAMENEACKKAGGVLFGEGCDTPHYKADVFFFSIILFVGTFVIATGLTSFKTSSCFPSFVRQTASDFAVLIAIVTMVGLDALIGLPTPKLMVPEKFAPSRPGRDWFVNPFGGHNPWWLYLAACVPALLATILIFMDQQITAVIVNRRENKLVKGNGYHLDLLVVAVCIVISSALGLPWYVAATVSAIAHILSLKKESECTAPGDRPVFLGVREQRVTALLVGILSGLSVLFTSVLQNIPMGVLYGVFLYMGIVAMKGMQFIDRVALMFMPPKYQPDHPYLRHVRIKRTHLFTFIQVICLVILWVIKSFKSVSIIFPIMVLGMCFVRKGMDYIFTQHELRWLDDVMAEEKKKAKDDEEKLATAEDVNEEDAFLDNYDKMLELKIEHDREIGKFEPASMSKGSMDYDRVNISEEMAKTSMWLKLKNSNNERDSKRKKSNKQHNNHSTRNSANKETKASFYLQDEDQMENIPEVDDEGNRRNEANC